MIFVPECFSNEDGCPPACPLQWDLSNGTSSMSSFQVIIDPIGQLQAVLNRLKNFYLFKYKDVYRM